MATRYWVGGSGTWDASTTTNWSASSGWAGGASVPGAGDDVIFDTSSSAANAAYTVTMSGTATCRNLTMDWPDPADVNKVTWAWSGTFNIYGTVNLTGWTAGITRTHTCTMNFKASTTWFTWTSNGVAFSGNFNIDTTGVWLTFNDSFNIGSGVFSINVSWAGGTCTLSSGTLTSWPFSILSNGNFVLGANAISCSTLQVGNTSWQWSFTANGGTITCSSTFSQLGGTLNLGTGTTVTCTTFDIGSNTTNAKVCTLGDANITCTLWGNNGGVAYQDTTTLTNSVPLMVFSGASSTITVNSGGGFQGGGFDYGTVIMNGANPTVYGYNTFTSFTWTGTAVKTNTLNFNNDQVISGNLTLNGNSNVNRAFIKGSTVGIPAIISVGWTITTQYCDFRDIIGTGAASWDLSGSTGWAGDAGGNTGITFSTPSTQHWVGGGGDLNWSTAANWTSRIPLPQDTAVMDYAFGTSQTITSDMPRLPSIDWTGATWTTALNYTAAIAQEIYGGWIGISGLTFTANASTLTLMGRGSHSLKTGGTTINQPITMQSMGGTYTMTGDFVMTSTRTLTLSNGTFDTGAYVLTVGLLTANNGTPSYPMTINFNTGTHIFNGTGTVINIPWGWYTIIPKTAYTLKITDTSSSSVTVNIGSMKMNNIWYARGTSTGTNIVTGGFSMNDFKDNGTIAHTIQFATSQYFYFTTFTVVGNAGQLISIASQNTGRVTSLFCKTGTINCNYLSIRDTLVGGGATWNGGANSNWNNGGNHFGTGFGWADAPTSGTYSKYRYWVPGGTGNWDSSTNWSTSSGGASGASAPNGHICIFDSNSGSGTVTVNTFSAYTGDIDCTGFAGKFACTVNSYYLTPSGSVKFVSGMDWSGYLATINKTTFMPSGSSKTIDLQSHNAGLLFAGLPRYITDEGIIDTWTFQSNYTSNYSVSHGGGKIDANGYSLTMFSFTSNTTSVYRGIAMGSGTWWVTWSGTVWSVWGGGMDYFNPGTSTVKIATTSATAKTFTGGGLTYNNIWFDKIGTTTISDSNTFNDFKMTENLTMTITFAPGSTTSFNTFTVTGRIGANGAHGLTSSGDQYYLRPLKGHFSVDYTSIQKANVLGVGYVGSHSFVDLYSYIENIFNTTPSTVISGTVSNGGGVSGAIVRLIRQEDNMVVGTTTTDGSGNYSFYADASKLYHVLVEYTDGSSVKYNAASLWNLTPV